MKKMHDPTEKMYFSCLEMIMHARATVQCVVYTG